MSALDVADVLTGKSFLVCNSSMLIIVLLRAILILGNVTFRM